METVEIEKALGTLLSGVVGGMIEAGMHPNNAFKFAAFVVIEGSLGREASAALGLVESTARRWRAQIADLKLVEVDDREIQALILDKMLPILGAPGLEVRVRSE